MSKPLVCLALPSREALDRPRMLGATLHASSGGCIVFPMTASSSLINHCFNTLWAGLHNALESGHEYEWWAIAHDDIELSPNWVETLIATAAEHQADFVSAYVPIKFHKGTVSAGYYVGDDPFDMRRYTIREMANLPETFTSDDVPGNLVLNTGCCVLRLHGEWVRHPERFLFDDQVRMTRNRAGEWKAQCFSEDWLFTDKIRRAGGRLASTRRVGCGHRGSHVYWNNTIWGSWETDEAYQARHQHENQVPSGLQISAERSIAVA
jgi:hypothetical protein